MDFLQHYLPASPWNKMARPAPASRPAASRTRFHSLAGCRWEGAIELQEFQAGALGSPDTRFQGQHDDFEVDSRQLAAANLELQQTDKLTTEAGVRLNLFITTTITLCSPALPEMMALPVFDGSCRYFRPEDRSDSFNNLNLTWASPTRPARDSPSSAGWQVPTGRHRMSYTACSGNSKLKMSPSSCRALNWVCAVTRVTGAEATPPRNGAAIVKDSDGFLVNDGETSHRGIEWQLSYAISRDGNWLPAVAGPFIATATAVPLTALPSTATIWIRRPAIRAMHDCSTNLRQTTAEPERVYLGSYLDAGNTAIRATICST